MSDDLGGAPAGIRERLERALSQPTRDWLKPDTGLSAAARYSVTLGDGSSVFVKAATDDDTERWLRTEHLALKNVPRRFAPGVVGWLDEPADRPILLVEDLRRAHWPASHNGVDWRAGDIDRVLAAVADLSSIPAPAALAPNQPAPVLWPTLLGRDRAAFLGLGLCSATWLADAGPVLTEAEAGLDVSGDRLVHGDLRSDNICIDGDRVICVDWSHAARGSAEHDLAWLLPTLHLEGGPPPYAVLPGGGRWAAAGCASLASRALHERGLPQWLIEVFVRLATIDLCWAASCLGLPQPE